MGWRGSGTHGALLKVCSCALHLLPPVCRVWCRHLQLALGEFPTDLVVYNAGTDVLSGDSLGYLNISEKV